MKVSGIEIAKTKNNWLSEQIDVQYPTKESLAGRSLYLSTAAQSSVVPLDTAVSADIGLTSDDLFLVDFHRLTVMFALLQSKRWEQQSEQELIVEFLTQIIYSDPCTLYLAFKEGEPVGAAILTQVDNQLLVSDIVLTQNQTLANKHAFSLLLVNKLNVNSSEYSDVYLEI
ncbi:flavodoxin [Vibrio caribbeanicus]|uniref:Flavodoxin n=1 Tax=Vibrio caribbeanicus TaxID=701175 RepID=A0ACC4NYK3_9VIBR|nr:hypothetical protein [Vibrio caribbeanicus]KHD25651.1 flavodoxin [Vibrio caribbeanicus]